MKWFAALVLPLALLALVVACEEEEEEAATATPSPGATAMATATPQATPSPEPSLTPEATPTPEATLPPFTDAECEYVATIGQQAMDLSDALSEISSLAANPRFLSEDWILGMALQLAILKITDEAASELHPPSSLASIHADWLNTTGMLAEAADGIAEGIDNLDAAKIEQASALMAQAGQDATRITTDVVEFGASRSGQCP